MGDVLPLTVRMSRGGDWAQDSRVFLGTTLNSSYGVFLEGLMN